MEKYKALDKDGIIEAFRVKIEQLTAELDKLKQSHWAELNTARCVLENRIEDLTALAEDLRCKELEIKKTYPGSGNTPELRENPNKV